MSSLVPADVRPKTRTTYETQTEYVKGNIEKIIFGSSVMNRLFFDYKQDMIRNLPKQTVVFADGGATSKHIAWMINQFATDFPHLREKIKKIVFQCGANDVDTKKNNNMKVAENVKSVFDLIKSLYPNAQIIFLPHYPRGDIDMERLNNLRQLIIDKIPSENINNDFWTDVIPMDKYIQSYYEDHIHLNQMTYNNVYLKMKSLME